MVGNESTIVDEFFGSHRGSKELAKVIDSAHTPLDYEKTEKELVRKLIRIELAEKAGDKFSVNDELSNEEIYLFNSLKANQKFPFLAYDLLSNGIITEKFKLAVIKECEKQEALEVLVQEKSLPIPSVLRVAMQNASKRIMISGRAGNSNEIDKFYVRSGAVPAQKKAQRL